MIFRQSSTVKLIYLMVALRPEMAINAWYDASSASAESGSCWRHMSRPCRARSCGPCGANMTVSRWPQARSWGQPDSGGTWWAWDRARLTSFLILFLFYLGYMALWAAIENDDTAADLTAGAVSGRVRLALLEPYASNFWNQGPDIQGASRTVGPGRAHVDGQQCRFIVTWPGFALACFIALVFLRTHRNSRPPVCGRYWHGKGWDCMPDLGQICWMRYCPLMPSYHRC